MKAIRITSLVLATLLILFMVGGAFLPKSLKIERSVQIDRPVAEVYPYVADFANWPSWNPWSEMEPGAVNTFSSPSSGKGASWSWEGTEIGKGSLTAEEVKENEYLHSKLSFLEPWESEAKDEWRFTALDENTTGLSWSNEMELSYPFERYYAFFLDIVLGKQMEKGLNKLKQVAEEK